jgi:type VI secretion system ImpM family protein
MPLASSPQSHPVGASLIGKVPCRADFVRFGPSSVATRSFDAWLVRAMERLHLHRRPLPATPIRFVYCSSDDESALAGALAPSKDKVGRSFPVAIVHAAAPSIAPETNPSFFDRVEALISQLPGLPDSEIRARLAEVGAPTETPDSDPPGARQDLLASSPASEFFEQAFGSTPAGQHFYAVLTLLRAAKSVSTSPAAKVPMLACPTRNASTTRLWLEILRRLAPTHAVSLFWSEHEPERLLFRWGAPSDDALCALADVRYSSSVVWPLSTDREASLVHARATLEERLAGERSVAQLAELLAGLQL